MEYGVPVRGYGYANIWLVIGFVQYVTSRSLYSIGGTHGRIGEPHELFTYVPGSVLEIPIQTAASCTLLVCLLCLVPLGWRVDAAWSRLQYYTMMDE